MKRLLLLSLLCLAAPPAAVAAAIGGPARVIDGDTLLVRGQSFRLLSIDAPETAQKCGNIACGAAATAYLVSLTKGYSVTCVGTEQDRYGRLLAHCRANGADLGHQMVAAGHAVVFRRYGDEYDAEERAARAAGLGFWSEPDAQLPWDFRAGKTVTAQPAAASSGCTIKGNINAKGARIYHTPGSTDYARTRIATNRGERWFCSESEARTAGWRPPHN